VKIVTQLEHDQLTPSGLMVHDHHHPAAPLPLPGSRYRLGPRIDDPAQSMGPSVGWDSIVDARGGQAMRRLRLVGRLACRLVMAPEPGPGGGRAGAPVRPGHRVGELTRATFAYYVGQDAVFLDAFCRAYALALAKSPDQDGLIAFRELLDAAAAELRLHRGYAERWDVDLHQAADLATAAYTNCSRRSSNSSSTGPIDGTLPPYSRHTRRSTTSWRMRKCSAAVLGGLALGRAW
jgi:hypothetical protein